VVDAAKACVHEVSRIIRMFGQRSAGAISFAHFCVAEFSSESPMSGSSRDIGARLSAVEFDPRHNYIPSR
jgi:hypothetical protein